MKETNMNIQYHHGHIWKLYTIAMVVPTTEELSAYISKYILDNSLTISTLVGATICNENDNFNKAVGRAYAKQNIDYLPLTVLNLYSQQDSVIVRLGGLWTSKNGKKHSCSFTLQIKHGKTNVHLIESSLH